MSVTRAFERIATAMSLRQCVARLPGTGTLAKWISREDRLTKVTLDYEPEVSSTIVRIVQPGWRCVRCQGARRAIVRTPCTEGSTRWICDYL